MLYIITLTRLFIQTPTRTLEQHTLSGSCMNRDQPLLFKLTLLNSREQTNQNKVQSLSVIITSRIKHHWGKQQRCRNNKNSSAAAHTHTHTWKQRELLQRYTPCSAHTYECTLRGNAVAVLTCVKVILWALFHPQWYASVWRHIIQLTCRQVKRGEEVSPRIIKIDSG